MLTLIVQGDLKRSNNRPPKSATAEQQYQMAVAVDILKECKVATESAVAEVAARYRGQHGHGVPGHEGAERSAVREAPRSSERLRLRLTFLRS